MRGGGIFGGLGVVILIVLAVIAYSGLFVVNQTDQALVLRFGNPVRVVTEPGLYAKIPLIDNVVMIDKRLLDVDSPPLEVIARDRKRLIVDAFGRYKITDPLLFYQAAGSIEVAESRLAVILNSAIRGAVGQMDFTNIVRDGRAGLMESITRQVNTEGRRLGVDVVDVRIRRADLPAENSQAVFQRMQTERQREATDIRSRGEQEAKTIRAQADRQATVIVAEANQQAEELRGDGDAAVNKIFAAAYGQDPEFFSFFRSMQAYIDSMKGETTRIVLSPTSPFFRYFADPLGGAAIAPSSPAPSVPAPAQPAPATP
ncbi:protease modulator HflC [Kaistia dalseonensis]|uniref:Protein HflC n=1 Tax=Kaistia dalseonensis TaxID=410840 RepID=A0ABU0HE27_9HYPH|nr:protease modulator HflC [Kaistia dalseonensis]MCX5497098.1 protease modulator HflC [Kaistia dalseonensis]MDQ0439724.1 membrane protease subunit HflC [Kaistia dalseonensis]